MVWQFLIDLWLWRLVCLQLFNQTASKHTTPARVVWLLLTATITLANHVANHEARRYPNDTTTTTHHLHCLGAAPSDDDGGVWPGLVASKTAARVMHVFVEPLLLTQSSCMAVG